jgi:hypothetical protein
MKATCGPRATLDQLLQPGVSMKELFCIADDDDYAMAAGPHQRLKIMQWLPFCIGRLKDYVKMFIWVTIFSGSITRT